jgi:hypothetical protein
MRVGNCLVKRRKNQMDTGENKLNAEMMKKLYEAYKLNTKKKVDEFNEAARKIISDKESPEAEDILKLVEGTPITDNHERRIHDPSIYKLHGRQVLNMFFDAPYPVMMPEDEKMMRGMSDEMTRKFQEYVESETEIPPYEMITIDSVPELIKEQAEYDAMMYGDTYIFGARPKKLITGCTKNFKTQRKLDALEAVFNIIDVDKPDRNGRIWERDLLTRQLMGEPIYLIPPRHHKSWMWLKFLEMQSYEIQRKPLVIPPSKKIDLYSVIHMKWPKPDLSNLKAHDFRYGNMWQDQELINYATGDVSHIDTILLDSLAAFGPDINSGYGLSTPNLNDIDKKKLERVIKRRKKK